MDDDAGVERLPNLLVTGTPGTGKTTLCAELAEATGWRHVNVGELVREKGLHDGRDEAFDTFTLNEDKVCDELEDAMAGGRCIVDFHTCDFFPERWFQLVAVLRADNGAVFTRLEKRGYSQKKVTENVEAEIMQVCLDEARESYSASIVHELRSDSVAEMRANVRRLAAWARARDAAPSGEAVGLPA